MIIAVDFDGVLCEKKWPAIGAPNIKLIDHLIKLKELGHIIILWTCRTSDPFIDSLTGKTRDLLGEAVEFCKSYGLTFDFINEPEPESMALFGGNPRKIYAHVYIDDANASEEFMEKYIIPYHRVGTYQEQIL